MVATNSDCSKIAWAKSMLSCSAPEMYYSQPSHVLLASPELASLWMVSFPSLQVGGVRKLWKAVFCPIMHTPKHVEATGLGDMTAPRGRPALAEEVRRPIAGLLCLGQAWFRSLVFVLNSQVDASRFSSKYFWKR